jgi:hypothetical protein
MSLQDDVATAAADFIAKEAILAAAIANLNAIVTGPASGSGSTVTVGAAVLKTIARVLSEASARLGSVKGEWSGIVTYNDGDVVRRVGTTYVCQVNGTIGTDPATQGDGPAWYLLIAGQAFNGQDQFALMTAL